MPDFSPSSDSVMGFDRARAARDMVADAQSFYRFGWLMGTSGNLSVRRDEASFLITASGKDKGRLDLDDFLLCGLDGLPDEPTAHRPSAETRVHCEIYRRFTDVGAIYHVHEPHAALCSDRDHAAGATRVRDVEMIKGLDIWEADAVVDLPILPNPLDTTELAEVVGRFLDARSFDADAGPRIPAVNILRHGFYAWGRSPFEARRHVESLAYLYRYSWEREAR